MTTAFPLTKDADGCILAIHVTPKASREGIADVVVDDAGKAWLKVKVSAPPEDGKANKAVIRLLSKSWKIPVSAFTVVSGETARQKRLHIAAPYASLRTLLTKDPT